MLMLIYRRILQCCVTLLIFLCLFSDSEILTLWLEHGPRQKPSLDGFTPLDLINEALRLVKTLSGKTYPQVMISRCCSG